MGHRSIDRQVVRQHRAQRKSRFHTGRGVRDFTAEDFIQATDRSLLITKDVRFTVRPDDVWQEGSYFTDDLGVRRRVEGVSQVGRSRFIEVLGRSFD